jgi:DNA-binding response OmpR family regulator
MTTEIALLLVEDESIIRSMLAESLEMAGFVVRTAGDGKTAIAALQDEQIPIRGVVTDIELGRGLDGWEVAQRARQLISDVPVVYMSGTRHHEWTSRGVPNSTFVAKPFIAEQVVTAISNLLKGPNSSRDF